MKKQHLLRNQEGFTLVEIIAVLIILGILAAVAVPRYIDLETSAKNRGLEAAVAELNGRESLAWANIKITRTSPNAYADSEVWTKMKADGLLNLGNDYVWTNGIPSGGAAVSEEVKFKGASMTASRIGSDSTKPAVWVKK